MLGLKYTIALLQMFSVNLTESKGILSLKCSYKSGMLPVEAISDVVRGILHGVRSFLQLQLI